MVLSGDYHEGVWGGDLHEKFSITSKQGKLDFILGTCPPFSTATLTRRSASILMFLHPDLRDAWSQWNINPQTTYWHYRSVLREERHVQRTAVTRPRQIKPRLIFRLHGKDLNLMVVENGFDKDIEFLTESSWTRPVQRHWSSGM